MEELPYNIDIHKLADLPEHTSKRPGRFSAIHVELQNVHMDEAMEIRGVPESDRGPLCSSIWYYGTKSGKRFSVRSMLEKKAQTEVDENIYTVWVKIAAK